MFVGALPLYGLHFPLCAAICLPLHLDVLTAYIAANVSNPLVAPFLITAEVQVGALLLEGHFISFDVEQARTIGIAGFAAQAAVGSVVLGTVLAALSALVTLKVVRREATSRDRSIDAAVTRTVARYASTPRPDRVYVRLKLQTDPVVEQLSALSSSFGDVLDLATGRGQLGLFLLELGAAKSLVGIDWDERKIAVARAASGDDARMLTGDLRAEALPEADTILLIDVLHYLPGEEQDQLLERAAAALRDGGQLIVREVDPHRGLGSRIAIWAERVATKTRYNRGANLEFRSPAEIAERLSALGLRVRTERDGRSPLENALIFAERPQAGERSS